MIPKYVLGGSRLSNVGIMLSVLHYDMSFCVGIQDDCEITSTLYISSQGRLVIGQGNGVIVLLAGCDAISKQLLSAGKGYLPAYFPFLHGDHVWYPYIIVSNIVILKKETQTFRFDILRISITRKQLLSRVNNIVHVTDIHFLFLSILSPVTVVKWCVVAASP